MRASSRAERAEQDAIARAAKQEQARVAHGVAASQRALEARLDDAERAVAEVSRLLPAPKPEKLRVLLLGASADGSLRVGREQKRIRAAVESSLHRDQIELDVRPAATTEDLLDGISKFRPHVIHFSGHSDSDLIKFEEELDEPHDEVIVSAAAFARAVRATDQPPLLVLLNSCRSAGHIDHLVEHVTPFAIGMADEIDDSDAIAYAARFYANIANGQSIESAHLAARAALELAGLDGANLPTLAWAEDVDPATTLLVVPTD
ncbi:CHAT domain-containing protein [Microbacterium sp. NPDC056003]|uniref:CHAT domain-containing protein n=1 Tax=Microbacterium sp. NPDC056003 TaxID=3345676 RepID=UPI0035E05565